MSQQSLDRQLSKQLNQKLDKLIDKDFRCISDAMILQTLQGNLMGYFSRGRKGQIFFILIHLFEQQEGIQIFDVRCKGEVPMGNITIEIKRCPLQKSIYALSVTDQTKPKGKNKSIFFMSIQLEEIRKTKSVEFYCSYSKKQEEIKDFIWHPYSPWGFMILLETKILIFNVEKNSFEPESQLLLEDLKIKNAGQRITKGSIQRITFCQNFNDKNQMSSFSKKLMLYLINNKGQIFLIFPFICPKTILNKVEKIQAQRLIKSPQNQRQKQIAQIFKSGEFLKVKQQEQEQNSKIEREQKWTLSLKPPIIQNLQVFKLNVLNSNPYRSSLYQTKVQITHFSVLTLSKTTLFIYTSKDKQLQTTLHFQTFSQNPYNKILSHKNYSLSQIYQIQSVSQIKLGKVSQKYNSIKIIQDCSEACLYFLVNLKACYRIDLKGLVKVVNVQQDLNDSTDQQMSKIKLIQLDVLFNAKNPFLVACSLEKSMRMIREFNGRFEFVSIQLRNMELKEKIRKVNHETNVLFSQLQKTNKNKIPAPSSESKVVVKQFSDKDLDQIQKKLQTFQFDYKESLQRKILNIKTLYENIKLKSFEIQKNQEEKQKVVKLIKQAEENDQRIKQLLKESTNEMTREEMEIRRRLEGSERLIDSLKEKVDNPFKDKSQSQIEIINDCQDQADGVIECLSGLKEKLIKKKYQLRRQLGDKRGKSTNLKALQNFQ